MTRYPLYASSTWNDIVSSHATVYSTARAGSSLAVPADGTDAAGVALVGQSRSGGGTYLCYEAMMDFDVSSFASNEKLASAHFRLSNVAASPSSPAWNLEVREHDWGAGVTTADWVAGASLGGKTLLAHVESVNNLSSSQYCRGGSEALRDRVATGGTIKTVFNSSRHRNGNAPTALSAIEYKRWYSSDQSGTGSDPQVLLQGVRKSQLLGVVGASTQLSDGSTVYLDVTSSSTATIRVAHKTVDGSATLWDTINVDETDLDEFGYRPSLQNWTIVRDKFDNFYVIGPDSQVTSTNTAYIFKYLKGGGQTWTFDDNQFLDLDSYSDGDVNNVAAVWFDNGGLGDILLVFSHQAGTGSDSAMSFKVVDCDTLEEVDSGSWDSVLPSTAAYVSFPNETGSYLDAVGNGSVGFIASSVMEDPSANVYLWRCTLSGSGQLTIGGTRYSLGVSAHHDANGKLRLVHCGASKFACIAHGRVRVFDYNGTVLGTTDLSGAGVATFPDATTFASTAAWDAIFDVGANKIWVYYISTANQQHLRRTGVSLASYAATMEETAVNTSVGATGTSNVAVRVPRHSIQSRKVVVDVANVTGGGTESLISPIDDTNIAPNAPILSTKNGFDARASTQFVWTFSDPNPEDTQSAFELEIDTHPAGTLQYRTGKIGAAPQFVSVGTAATGNNTSVTPGLPANISPGDLLIVVASIRNSGTGTVDLPSGYTSFVNFGNVRVMGKYVKGLGESPAEAAPLVTFTGGAAGADTIAQMFAFRGAHATIGSVTAASATLLNGSAQNIAYPALDVPGANHTILYVGWKQDDFTSVVSPGTEIQEATAIAGSDAGQVVSYTEQTTEADILAGSFTVTGGAAAISRGITLALAPRPAVEGTASNHTLAASGLTNGVTYRWRVRTYDASGLQGSYASYGTFTTAAKGLVTITDPSADNPAGLDTASVDVTWTYSAIGGATQASRRVQVIRTSNSTVHLDTGMQATTDQTYSVTGLLTDVEYRIEVSVLDTAASTSDPATRLVTPSFANPELPTVVLVAGDSYVDVSITNPESSGDEPTPTVNRILRRVSGGSADVEAGETGGWVEIGSTPINTTYRDYTAASGVSYEYKVIAEV
jgi:hypothetical protein